MDPLKQHRTRIKVLLIATFVCVLLLAISFWNYTTSPSHTGKIMLPLFLVLVVIGFSAIMFIFQRAFNAKAIKAIIQTKVNEERARVLAEFETKEEEVINTDENIDEVVKRCLPKGSFKTPAAYSEKLLKLLSSELQASVGVVYQAKGKKYSFLAGFALPGDPPSDFSEGENLTGQVAQSKEIMVLNELPEDYFEIESGLGKSKPKTLIIIPLLQKNKTIAILEIATFIEGDERIVSILKKISEKAAEKITQSDKA